MVRIVLNDPKIRAGVVCDRLVIGKDDIKDISVGYTCATFPLKNIKVFVPERNELISVSSPQDFVDIAAAHSEKSILSGDTLDKWRRQVAALSAASSKSEEK